MITKRVHRKAYIISKAISKQMNLSQDESPDFVMLHKDVIETVSDIELETLDNLLKSKEVIENKELFDELKLRRKEFEYLKDDPMMLIGISDLSQKVFNYILTEICLNNFNEEIVDKSSDLICNLYNKNKERNKFDTTEDPVDNIIDYLEFFGVEHEEQLPLLQLITSGE